jgi:hypothetical protein
VVEVGWFCGVVSVCIAFLAAVSACTHCIWLNSGIRESLDRIKNSVVKNFVYFFQIICNLAGNYKQVKFS